MWCGGLILLMMLFVLWLFVGVVMLVYPGCCRVVVGVVVVSFVFVVVDAVVAVAVVIVVVVVAVVVAVCYC